MSISFKFLAPTLCAAVISTSGFAQNAPPAGNDLVAIVSMLGPLANSLILAYSMDNSTNGSVVFATDPKYGHAHIFGNRKFVKDGDRQCLSFEEPGTFLSVFGVIDLKDSYTLATWAKLPFVGENAVVWTGMGVDPLHVVDGTFACSVNNELHAFCPYDKSLTGWHHLAVTCDGRGTSLYIDGVAKGTVPLAIAGRVTRIGGQMSPQQPANGQCGLLDDMLFFNRALTPPELTKLLAVRLPVHQPSPEDLVARPSMNTPTTGVAGTATTTFPPGMPFDPRFPRPQLPGSVSPSSPTSETLGAANEIVKDYRNSLVFVTGGNGAGSGFIANLSGKSFLLTNAHVAAGVRGAAFKTLQGTPVTPGAASVAVGHDIFTMQAATSGAPFEVMREVSDNTAIGDDVVVLGNAEGGGVINTIMGKIVGIGPNLVEVDAPFQPGNSGSPIIHLKSKKVIAVATYLTIRKYDTATRQPIKDPVIRRFGYRIDSVKTWQPVDWRAFTAQAAEVEGIESLTNAFIAFIKDLADDGKISSGAHENPVIRARIETWLASKNKHSSVKDLAAADQNFIAFLKVASQSDVNAARTRLTYDYFQRQLGEQQKERTEIGGIFGKIIEGLGKGR